MTAIVSLAFGLLYAIVGCVGLSQVGMDKFAVGMTVVGITLLSTAGILVRHALALIRGSTTGR